MRWRAEFNGYADPEHGNIVEYEDYAKLKAENETLRAAIVTPEVYVGVVSEIVEKDWAEQRKRAQAERDALKAELEAEKAERVKLSKVLDEAQEEVSRLRAENAWLRVQDAKQRIAKES